jgi:hypothetical protein
VTKGQLLTGEVISNLAANKKVTVAFNDKQVGGNRQVQEQH